MAFTNTSTAPVSVEQAGVKIAVRQNINFTSGATVTDNPGNNSADVSISGATTPGGSNTDVQYNNSGIISGSNNFTFDGANVSALAGVVSSVGFIFSRYININIVIPNHCSMINSNPVVSGSITLLGDAELILL